MNRGWERKRPACMLSERHQRVVLGLPDDYSADVSARSAALW